MPKKEEGEEEEEEEEGGDKNANAISHSSLRAVAIGMPADRKA